MKQDYECDSCMNYEFDVEYENYYCQLNLDEDERVRFITYRDYHCPYFRFGDEYAIVKKQM